MTRTLRVIILILLIFYSFPVGEGEAAISNQVTEDDARVNELIGKMTPEEKVGQLFLVSFQGREVSNDSEIADLIANHHVGGVVLNLKNDNFTSLNTVAKAYSMISALQSIEWTYSVNNPEFASDTGKEPSNYIPMFIAISQEGDSYPNDAIINGLSTMPSQLAIGATWDLELAEGVGRVLGDELSAIGINMLLGPSLDVFDLTYVEGEDDLGARTFGGDPYWVGELGKSYIRGVHLGSNNQIAVISKHFPGRGSSDRLPENEVATVRKSLEQLKQVELAPFYAVTGNAVDSLTRTDGLLMSHIRYQGFQGNIRSTTKPVSFDQAAQDQLMSLPPLNTWRKSGGVVVSDNLGSLAVRKFFNPRGEGFDPRQIARNALISGNDLLMMDLYVNTSDLDPYSTTLRVLEFFTQKYLEDQAFAQKVDQSLMRILKLKFQLYGEFELGNVIPNEERLETVGTHQQINLDIAINSVVLMSPDLVELGVILPRPPQANERIIFISDIVTAQQCTECPPQTIFGVTSFQDAVMRLYGPGAGEVVTPSRISSYTFDDLNKYMSSPGVASALDSELRNADWIVFSFIKPKLDSSSGMVIEKFLAERPDLISNKKIIAFGFNAPYYLDATDISKITAYYVLFSKTNEFIDTAARLLFQEISASGVLPLSVPGIGYDLISRTAPNPSQVIPLIVRTSKNLSPSEIDSTEAFTGIPIVNLGEMISMETGVILDYNANPVPDGTIVRFLITYVEKGTNTQQIEATTEKGVAKVAYRMQNTGLVEIRVVSDPAYNSEIRQVDVPVPEGAEATIVVLSTPQLTETPKPTETISPVPIEDQVIIMEKIKQVPDAGDWVGMILIVSPISFGAFSMAKRKFSIRWRIRIAILALIGGFSAYILTTIMVLVKFSWIENIRSIHILAFSLIGALAGVLSGWFWYKNNHRNVKKQ